MIIIKAQIYFTTLFIKKKKAFIVLNNILSYFNEQNDVLLKI